jgi:hypothetical protein
VAGLRPRELTEAGRRALLRRDDPEPSPQELRYEDAVDAAVRAAATAGAFRDLPGRGRPLPEDHDALGRLDPRWLGLHLLRNAGVLPPFVEAGRRLEARQEASRRAEAAWRSAPGEERGARAAELEAAWEAENEAIRAWNRQVPPWLTRYPAPIARRWERLRAASGEAPQPTGTGTPPWARER